MALSGYGVYAEVTFAASAVDEAIPFLTVYLSDLPTAWHDAMANAGDTDGRTIRVTKSDGTTECAVYVPPGGVNTTTDTGAILLRATDLSAVVDTVYMIWVGNAASTMYLSTDTYGRNAVFSGYAGAYIPGMTTDDLTGAGRNLTAVNSPGTAASGYEGITAATYTAASTQYHYYSGTSAVTNWPITLEALGYAGRNTADDPVFMVGGNSNSAYLAMLDFGNTGDLHRSIFWGTGSTSTASSSGAYSTATWYYLAGTRDANTGTSRNYVDGAANGTDATTITAPTFDRLSFGARYRNTVTNAGTTRVAVALLSSSVRSADYVSTMNKNWLGTLYTASAVMYVTGTTGKLKLQTAATLSTSGSLVDWAGAANAITIATDNATATIDDVTNIDTEYLKLTNIAYNYAVPGGKSNYETTYYVTRYRQSGGALEVNNKSIRFIGAGGAYEGDDLGVAYVVWPTTATEAAYAITGVTLDETDFDADTGIALQATAVDSSGAVEARVQFVCVEITWDEGAPATDYGNFFEAYGAFGNVA